MGVTSKCSDVINILKQVTVEPFMFFFVFAYSVRLVSFQDLLVDRACTLILKYPQETCDNPEKFKVEHGEAQKIGNNLYVGHAMLSTLPALVIATFVGPWSDKYGRRIPMFAACIGSFMESTLTTVLASFPNILPTFYLIPALFAGISGGFITSMSSCYSYMSDITEESSRQSRFAILEFFYIMSAPLATLIGGFIYKSGGPISVLSAGPVSFGLAFAWAAIMLKEPRQRQSKVTGKEMFKDLFNVANLKEIIRTSTVKRPGNIRLQIWLLIFAVCSIRLVDLGSLAIGYNFSKKMYLWDVPTYSNAVTVLQICAGLTTLTVVPLLSRSLFVHEGAVGLSGVLSLMAKLIVLCVAEKEWLFFFAWFAGLLGACGRIAVRSRLSKLVSKKEQGRVFALSATCESLTPVLGMLMFSQIYNATLNIYPGMPYFVAAIFLVPTAVIFGWITKMPTTSFGELEEETVEDTRTKELQEVAAGGKGK